MQPLSRNRHATRSQLARWSTLSRNAIEPFLLDLGIAPLRNRFPMERIYHGLLGLTPGTTSEEKMLAEGLIRLGDVADLIHIDSEVLLDDVRNGKNGFPPLFVFGPRRHLFLKAQIDAMRTSPRNAWHEIPFATEYAAPQSRLALMLKVTPARIKAALENKSGPPAHVISKGVKRYILASVAHRLVDDADTENPPQETGTPQPLEDGKSVFVQAANAATADAAALTPSASNARGGDNAHAVPTEAKLSGT